MVILELGCAQIKPARVTIDAIPGGSIQAELPPLPADILAAGERYDMVEAYHFWEHLYKWEADQLAREVYSVLVPGGAFVLELPDLRKCCEFVAGVKPIPQRHNAHGNPDPRFLEWGIFGAQTDPPHVGNPYQAHKWGYTPESLMIQLKATGFREFLWRPQTRGQPERDMRIEAIK